MKTRTSIRREVLLTYLRRSWLRWVWWEAVILCGFVRYDWMLGVFLIFMAVVHEFQKVVIAALHWQLQKNTLMLKKAVKSLAGVKRLIELSEELIGQGEKK